MGRNVKARLFTFVLPKSTQIGRLRYSATSQKSNEESQNSMGSLDLIIFRPSKKEGMTPWGNMRHRAASRSSAVIMLC